MNPRRLRAILMMIFLWGVCAAVIGAVFGVGSWLLRPSWSYGLLSDAISFYALAFASGGVLGGAAFALILSRHGERSQVAELGRQMGIRWWIGVGMMAGFVGYLFVRAAQGQLWTLVHPYSRSASILNLLEVTGLFGLIGGGVGSGILAIARRGKEMPGGLSADALRDPGTGSMRDLPASVE